MKKIVHKELSYKVNGILFNVFKSFGGAYQEKYYQKALKQAFLAAKIPYLEQVRVDLNYKERNMGRYYLDFLIDNKLVLEIKAKSNLTMTDVIQVLNYLKASNIELGIIANFTKDGVRIRRVLRGR